MLSRRIGSNWAGEVCERAYWEYQKLPLSQAPPLSVHVPPRPHHFYWLDLRPSDGSCNPLPVRTAVEKIQRTNTRWTTKTLITVSCWQDWPVPSSSWTISTNTPHCTNLILQMTLGFKFQPLCGRWRVMVSLNALTTACCSKVSRIWRIQLRTMFRGWHWKLNTERNPTLFCFLPSLCKRLLSFLYRRSFLPRGRFQQELLWTEIRSM